jgi:beta-mannosidase
MSISQVALRQQQILNHGWFFKERQINLSLEADFATPQGWYSCRVPSSTYQNLLEQQLIPDPYYDQNEKLVQWVGERDWLYRLEFNAEQNYEYSELCFDGLDTFASVYLNGELILESQNMFLGQRIPVQLQAKNTLEIHFKNAWLEGLKRMEANGGAKPLWNGDASRVHVRKAQYHYSWDWGPKLLDSGIWQEIRLEQFNARIYDVTLQTKLEPNFETSSLDILLHLNGQFETAEVVLTLCDPNGIPLEKTQLPATAALKHQFMVLQPRLWYPHTLGSQPLYCLKVVVVQDGIILDQSEQSFGIRQVRVVQEPVANQSGSSFYFEINGIAMFTSGANWIPDDLMLARVTTERYYARIEAAKNANMTMLRIWGGGIYENKVFYDLCDQMGIMIWQDFMFGCGIYPSYPAFLENVKQEASDQIKRLRNHPSIVIWTGNNEDYPLAFGQGLYDASTAPDATATFGARVIYEQILPSCMQEFAPDAYYQAGSPFFGAFPDDQTIGDRHTWDVWGSAAVPYRDYQHLGGRFVSEFGMCAAPRLETLREVIPTSQWSPSSPSFEHHMKADQGMMRLNKYAADIAQNLENLEDFVFATQIVQSEALNAAYRIWRRAWGKSNNRACGGALVWQLNDCWQVSSWAIIDSSHRYKPAYYTVKRALQAITINLWTDGAIWASNHHLETWQYDLEIRIFDLQGQVTHFETRAVDLAANASTELGRLPQGQAIYAVRLLQNNQVIARDSIFPEPYVQFELPKANIQVEQIGQHQLRISTDKPVKAVWLETNEISDNMLDLMPNDPQILELPSIPEQLELRFLGGQKVFNLQAQLVVGDD